MSAGTPTINARIAVRGVDDARTGLQRVGDAGATSMQRIGSAASVATGAIQKAGNATAAVARGVTGVASVASFVVGGLASTLTGVVGTAIGLANTVAKVAAGVTLLGTASAGGAVAAGRSLAFSTAKGIEDAEKLAEALGLTVEQLTELQSAARLLGISQDAIAQALSNVARKAVDAAEGSEEAQAAFTQMNISIRDSKGALKDASDLFAEALDNVSEIENPILRAKAANDLFGASAAQLGPLFAKGADGLEELIAKTAQYGNVIDDEAAKENRVLLDRRRRLDESLGGLKISFSRIFLPFFTASADAVSQWLNRNRTAIEGQLEKLLEFVDEVKADLVLLFSGNEGEFNFALFEALEPAVAKAKLIVLDLWDAITKGRLGNRVPEFGAFVGLLQELGRAAAAAASKFLGLATDKGLPSFLDILKGGSEALKSFTAALQGRDADVTVPWAGKLAKVFEEVAKAIISVGAIIVANRDAILDFAVTVLGYLNAGLDALSQRLAGGKIADENQFSFLNGWEKTVRETVESMRKWFDTLYNDVTAVITKLTGALVGAGGIFDKLGAFFGLGNKGEDGAYAQDGSAGRQLAILVLIGAITGAFPVLAAIVGVIAGLSIAITNFLTILAQLGKTFGFVFGGIFKLVSGLGTLWASVVTVGIVAAIAALAYLIYTYWDEIVAFIGGAFDMIVDLAKAGLSGIGSLFSAVWEFISGGAGAAVEAIYGFFAGIGQWFVDKFDAARQGLSDFWDWLTSRPQAAWDSLKSIWGGFADFFAGPIERVRKAFANLWDGIKNNSSNAWSYVKSIFGAGRPTASPEGGGEGEALPSFDVGGVVPGSSGSPVKALVHGGERILTVQETSLFDRMMAGLDAVAQMASAPMMAMQPALAPVPARGGMSAYDFDVQPGDRQILATPAGAQWLQSSLRKQGIAASIRKGRR